MAVPFAFHGHRSLTIGVPAGMFCGWKARSNGRGHGSCQSALYSWTLPIGIRSAQRTEKYPSGSVQRAVVFHPKQSLRLLCWRPLFLDAPTGVNGLTCSVVRQKKPGNLMWVRSLGTGPIRYGRVRRWRPSVWVPSQFGTRRFGEDSRGVSSLDERPVLRISPGDLERLLGTLDVNFVALSECLVSRGYSLELVATNAPGIHYNIVGTGRAIVGNRDPLPLMPHTLISSLFRRIHGSESKSQAIKASPACFRSRPSRKQ
jgi:hypothetical protein